MNDELNNPPPGGKLSEKELEELRTSMNVVVSPKSGKGKFVFLGIVILMVSLTIIKQVFFTVTP
jgi:hypothetical protein